MGLFPTCTTRPGVLLDLLIQSVQEGSKIRLVTLEGQQLPQRLYLSYSKKLRNCYPIGTVYQIDCRIVQHHKGKEFLRPLRNRPLQLSLDFYEHNRKLQQSTVSSSR